MNKKIIGSIVAIILLCFIVFGTFFLMKNRNIESEKQTNNNNTNETTKEEKQDNEYNEASQGNKKVLVVYFSATNNTKSVASKIAENLNGDLFEIEPFNKYTSEDLNYNDPNSRVSKEHDDENLRNVKLKNITVDNWDSYDTVLIGYPIWWGIAAWPVDTFITSNNFEDKTVIPFCTSVSSGLGQSGKLLEEKADGGNWLDGYSFSSKPSDDDIKTFTDSIN